MPQKTVLKANGLYTDPNQLSSVPEGALLVADNVIIDRDNVIESRRGNAQYGNPFGLGNDTANQLLNYKDRILIHYNDTLLYNNNEHNTTDDGEFLAFSGNYTETEPGLRIKSVESNRNLYFTTNDGIKKISAATADDFTTDPDFIVDAGAVKALDVTGTLNFSSSGFLTANSKVAYRVVWGYNDANNNLILGAPSSRLVISNATNQSATVDLEFTIPAGITDQYFYQVYRTAVFTVPDGLTLDDIDPGDEMNLIIEDPPETLSGSVTVTDVSPEDFRVGGASLYTNPSSGEGIDQSNDPPPLAKDITLYQNSAFYANTESLARTTITLLSTDDLQSGVSQITIDNETDPAQTYTFVGEKEETLVDFSSYNEAPNALGDIDPFQLDGKYWLLNSASNVRKYYVWYSNNKTTQILNFSGYVGDVSVSPTDLDGKWMIIPTEGDNTYYLWFNGTGTTEDPAIQEPTLATFTSMEVDISSITGLENILEAAYLRLVTYSDLFGDFDVTYSISATETDVSISNPGNFNETEHRLETGDVIEVTSSTTTPSLVGTHTVTKVDDDNFTVPVNVTTGGTADWKKVIVSSVSIGNPAVFTEADHGLESNDLIEVVSTTTDIVPDIYVVTRIDKDTFSINQEATVAGTANWQLINTAIYLRTAEFDETEKTIGGVVGDGFVHNFNTPINSDPTNSTDVNLDVIGRTSINVNISRGVSTVAQLADATAFALADQDSSQDFDKENLYTSGNSFITVINTNNGNTDDASDAAFGDDALATATAGNPTIINSTSHGLKTGDYITISGSTTTPTIDGNYNITKIDDDSFSVEVLTTLGGNAPWSSDQGLGNGFSITVTNQGDGEDSANNDVLLSGASTPAQRIDETARSLVSIINKNPSETISAFYLSGSDDIPGQILLEARDIGIEGFTITASDADTGGEFNPAIPPAAGASTVSGTRESNPNRIFFSKIQQPEAVPIVNFIDVGPKDKEISRIISLRESLFILKEDGVYRLTGIDGNFIVDLFDESTKIVAPDTAVVLNNQILCLTNQGVAQISDTGVEIISKQLDNVINTLINPRFNFRLTSFGVSYETDRAYWLWLPTFEGDTVATQAYRYNTFTRSWTRIPISKTCGIVNSGDNKLYLGAADENFIERERKDLNRRDFADRENDYFIVANGVSNGSITLSQANVASVGDSLVQTQYLTIDKFNQILKKLDADAFVNSSDYLDELEMVPGDNQVTKLDALANKLDGDGLGFSDYLASLDNKTASGVSVSATNPAVINSVSHGLNTGRTVVISNSTTVLPVSPNIDGTYTVTRIDDDNFSIDVQVTVAGTCDYTANVNTLEEVQGGFNTIVNKLNLDTGVLDTNYPKSEGSFVFESLVLSVVPNVATITLYSSLPFVEGVITLYESIPCQFLYVPETFGDVSLVKQINEGTIIVQDNTFTGGFVGYKTDQSPGVEDTAFTLLGKGDFGFFNWSGQNWGGGFAQAPIRTYVPRNKQRCRQIQAQFTHSNAREIWAVYGYSYTFRGISERAYRR